MKKTHICLSPYQSRNIINPKPNLALVLSIFWRLWSYSLVTFWRVTFERRLGELRGSTVLLKLHWAQVPSHSSKVQGICCWISHWYYWFLQHEEKVLEESRAHARQTHAYIKTYVELLIFSYQQNQTKNLRVQLRVLLVQLVHASKIPVAFSLKCWEIFFFTYVWALQFKAWNFWCLHGLKKIIISARLHLTCSWRRPTSFSMYENPTVHCSLAHSSYADTSP